MAQCSAQHDLLRGGVRALTLRLALPGLVSMLASGLSALLDAVFLARIGPDAAAAAGLCFPLVTLIQTIGFTLGMGAGSFISRTLGREGTAASGQAEAAASLALYGAAILGAALCLVGQLFPRPLLRLLGAQDTLLPATAAYARFVLFSAPLTCASLVLSSLLRGQGHTACAMVSCGAGLALGAGLGALLTPRLGIAGAGAALLTREALVLLLFLYYTLRTPGALHPPLRAFSLKPRVFADVMRFGTPTLARQGLMSVSGVMLSRTCAQIGAPAVAGMGFALRAVNLVSSTIIGFGQGFSPVCGAACGAGRLDRVQEAYRFCLRLLTAALLALGAAVFFLAPGLLSRIGAQAEAAQFGALVLRAQSAVFFAQGAVILMNMLTQSMGLTVRASLVACSRQGYVLIALLLLLPRAFGAWGLILAQPSSDLISLGIGWLLTRPLMQKARSARLRIRPAE